MGERNRCPRCGEKMDRSDVEGYAFVCYGCDENFYGFEAVEPRASNDGIIANRELVRAMDTIVQYMNNEMAYEIWICAVPDGADDEDFEAIAGDATAMNAVCSLFRGLIAEYGYAGWFTDFHGEPPFEAYGADEDEG